MPSVPPRSPRAPNAADQLQHQYWLKGDAPSASIEVRDGLDDSCALFPRVACSAI
jgi:hypothetical protein